MATRNVPGTYATIADAIAAASPGDTIAVSAAYGGNETATVTVDDLGFDAPASVTGITLLADGTVTRISHLGASSITILGSAAGETITGGDGNDALDGRFDSDIVKGGAGNDSLTVRNDGVDVLDGGEGDDILKGGAGADISFFNTALGASNVDRIVDFAAIDDTLRLENGIFTALTKAGTLAAGAFKDIGAAGAVLDADDRVLYDSRTGAVSDDADGSGSADALQFALLTTRPVLTFQDILVV